MSASSSLATFAADEASAEEWFALDRGMQAKVHSVVAGQSTELDLSHSNFTHIPGGVVATWTALTTLNLYNCSSLADESKDLARRLLQCNEKIRDGPSGSPERFHMTTYDFAATILFGSSSRYGAGAAAASGQVGGGGDGGGGGGVGGANDEAENDGPPRRRPRAAASEGCILGKINELGEDGGASDFKKNMADFCGVSFKGAFEGWAQELKEKFGLVRGSGSGS